VSSDHFHFIIFRDASVFLHPVTNDIAPGYHNVVHRLVMLFGFISVFQVGGGVARCCGFAISNLEILQKSKFFYSKISFVSRVSSHCMPLSYSVESQSCITVLSLSV
jgi:hypothetical protein